jgi:hypothetical protein
MAKPIIVTLDGAESSFDHGKVERSKLYGARKRIPLDMEGNPCIKSSLTADALYLLQGGMTAQGYFDETGRWLQKGDLVGLGEDNQPLELKSSTLGVAQPLEAVAPGEILRHSIDAVYALDPIQIDGALQARLDGGEAFRFGFNYGADYHLETAFLVRNAEGCFCLVGVPCEATWCEPGKVAVVEEADTADADELDFDMF